jgi:hypothetical protein
MSGCSAGVDSYCLTHSPGDFLYSEQAHQAMTVEDKRKVLKELEWGADRCGWKPGN